MPLSSALLGCFHNPCIQRIRLHGAPPHDPTQVKERCCHLEDTARNLLADFRQVAPISGSLDRGNPGADQRNARSDQARGGLQEEIFHDRKGIRDSDPPDSPGHRAGIPGGMAGDDLEKTIEEGLEQTAGCMDRRGAAEGDLVVFDRMPHRSWEEKMLRRVAAFEGREIVVWGMSALPFTCTHIPPRSASEGPASAGFLGMSWGIHPPAAGERIHPLFCG